MRIAGRLSKHQSGIIATGEGMAPTLSYSDYKEPQKVLIMEYVNNKGPCEAEEGDGIVTGRPYAARKTVMKDNSFAITTEGGGVCVAGDLTDSNVTQDKQVYDTGGISPAIKSSQGSGSREKILWPDGSSKTGSAEAEIGDGVKIYPNPARENSGGTVQKGRTNALNTYPGGGSGTPVSDGERLRIRYLTPRECLRLQAFPDDAIDKLEKVLSKSALYKVAGNSIAVCCLKAIFKGIYIDKTFRSSRQANLDRWF